MNEVDLGKVDNPFDCVWYCFQHQRYCEECSMLGECHATTCPHTLGVVDKDA